MRAKAAKDHMPALPFHDCTAEEALARLGSGPYGLTEEEAARRAEACGANALPSKKRGGALRLFFAQFKDFMTILLLCAAAVSAVIAYVTEDVHELADTGILLLIILLNTFVGFLQQYRADSAIEKLKKLSVCSVKTLRGGKDLLLDSERLVPGDVILLEEGDMVPADCRILTCERLRADESALTGESAGVSKRAAADGAETPVFDRRCMLYSSSFVVGGQAKAVVVRTGAETEIGRISPTFWIRRTRQRRRWKRHSPSSAGSSRRSSSRWRRSSSCSASFSRTARCWATSCPPWRSRSRRSPRACPPSSPSSWRWAYRR